MRIGGATLAECQTFLRRNRVSVSYNGLRGALRSPLLAGRIVWGGETNAESFPPVLDADTLRLLAKVEVPRGRRSKSARRLARLRVLCCGTCGGFLQVATSKSARYPVYKCGNPDCDRHVSISAEVAERELSEFTRAHLKGLQGRASAGDELADADRAVEEAEPEIDRAVEAFEGMEDVASVRAKLREKLDAAHDRQDHLRRASGPAALVLDAFRDWDDISFAGQRDLIRAVVESATVRTGRGDDRITIAPLTE